MNTNTVGSDLSYEVMLRRMRRGELKTPPLDLQNQERHPEALRVPRDPRPAFFDPEELTPERVIR